MNIIEKLELGILLGLDGALKNGLDKEGKRLLALLEESLEV